MTEHEKEEFYRLMGFKKPKTQNEPDIPDFLKDIFTKNNESS